MKTFNCEIKAVLKENGATGPICHLGSLFNSKDATDEVAANHRRKYAQFGGEYVGIDLFPGPNVDITADLTDPGFLDTYEQLRGHFGIAICMALLEHVQNPFAVAKNIEGMLRPGGHLFFSGPWVQGFHGYPSDYWRISFEGLKVLFPNIKFDDWWYSGSRKHIGVRMDTPEKERARFRTEIDGIVSDRAMSYLMVGAIGRLI